LDEKSMTRWIVSPSLYAVRERRIVATGRDERDIEKRVLRLFFVEDWLDRMIARSIASFEVVGSAMDDARLRWGEIVVVGESSPLFVDCCSKRAVT
jgi:hypothetical protein